MLIINGNIYTEKGIIENGYLLIKGTTIASFGLMAYAPEYDGDTIDAKGQAVIPGFIDQHIHGAFGSDHMDATPEALHNIVTFLPREGTTSYLPTTMTQSTDAIQDALKAIVSYMKNENKPGETHMLGIHVEGPFINALHAGAQNPMHIQKPTVEAFKQFESVAKDAIRLITYAPEKAEPGFTNFLRSRNVIASAGHTDANYQDIMKAVDEGLTNMTHFHNAMLPHHHRIPGAVTAGFVSDQLYTELIVDGIHVHPDSVYATYKIKGANRIIGITDAMRAKGLEDGIYDLGGQSVTKVGKECKLTHGNALAGSVAEMDFVARNLKSFTQCSMEELILMTSTNAARQLGVLGSKGTLAIGKDADILIVNENIEILTTVCRGVIAYQKDGHSSN